MTGYEGIISTPLQNLLGGRAAEAVLLALFHQGEVDGRSGARDFAVSLDSVQRQLDRFERSGALVCKRQGRTLVDTWNPKSRLASRLRELTGMVYDGPDSQTKEKIFANAANPAPRTSR